MKSRLQVTKLELKRQRDLLARYNRYLPILKLKKRQLKQEIERARARRLALEGRIQELETRLEPWVATLGESVPFEDWLEVVDTEFEVTSLAGIELPEFVDVRIEEVAYDLYETPLWVDSALMELKLACRLASEREALVEQETRLTRAWRVTSQRVNQFETIRIPEAEANIRRILVVLGDRQTAAFGWALLAKRKLEALEE